jgi:hypothetical protein
MREITECQVEDPGAVPGASNNSTAENHSGKGDTTEQRSVEIANRVSPRGGDDRRVGRGLAGHAQECVCEGCLILSAIPDSPDCVKPKGGRKPRGPRRPKVAARSGDCESSGNVECGSCHHVGHKGSCDLHCVGCLAQARGEPAADAEPVRMEAVPQAEPALPSAPIRVCEYPQCTCLLGAEVEGAFCSIHKQAIADERARLNGLMVNPERCARKGCDRDRVKGSIWCSGHATCDASVTCDGVPAVGGKDFAGNHEGGDYEAIPEDPEQPNDKQPPSPSVEGERMRRLVLAMYELGWEMLAEDTANDPLTVARCKQVCDLELRSLGVLS